LVLLIGIPRTTVFEQALEAGPEMTLEQAAT
jgi:hypothetical protein